MAMLPWWSHALEAPGGSRDLSSTARPLTPVPIPRSHPAPQAARTVGNPQPCGKTRLAIGQASLLVQSEAQAEIVDN
jgi:hypothetical protein